MFCLYLQIGIRPLCNSVVAMCAPTYFWKRRCRLYSARLMAGWSGVRFPVQAGNFFLHRIFQTSWGAHPASYSMGTRGLFPWG